ncbi:MAG: hypothetical protein KAT05_01880, partial [Spirochaetes bacterium]|nr:hypothetical protein [Spirochaetota bacterium]
MKYASKEDLEKAYNKHISLSSIDGKNPNEILQICGELIDSSFYLKKEKGVKNARLFLEELKNKSLSDEQKARLYYCLGNAYADIDTINATDTFSWNNENKEKAIYNYRKALGNNLDKNTKSQVLINLSNLYDELGRLVKSVELYQKAIDEKPEKDTSFMANGNKGISLINYRNIIYDKEHKMYFGYFAYHCLKEAINSSQNTTEEKKAFEKSLKKLNTQTFEKIKVEDLKLNDFSLGESEEEKQYRQWCLKNHLFLNPVNDLGNYNIAAHDVLHLPNMILEIDLNHVEFPSFFNQLKQEYASARYLIYEGMINIGTKHFSDREVLLINPLDYPRYSLHIEKIKMSFKTLYSIFDKIEKFIREYLKLTYSVDENRITFRNMWYENAQYKINNQTKGNLHPMIRQLNNRAFQGLFTISKELTFHHPDFNQDNKIMDELKDSLEPSAKEINLLRNNLEHGYVKVHENFHNLENEGMFKDNLSYSIKESELIDYSLKLLKLCREGLIYLSLGVYIEEMKKGENSKGKTIPSMKSDIYEDEWKN